MISLSLFLISTAGSIIPGFKADIVEKIKLTKQLNSGLTVDQEQTIQEYASLLRKGLSVAETQFQARRHIIELLNVTATLRREDGQKVAYVSCVLGENMFELSHQRNTLNKNEFAGGNLRDTFNGSGMGGGNKFQRW